VSCEQIVCSCRKITSEGIAEEAPPWWNHNLNLASSQLLMRRKADFVVSWELYTEEVRNAKIRMEPLNEELDGFTSRGQVAFYSAHAHALFCSTAPQNS
jgi:hypothetical protein